MILLEIMRLFYVDTPCILHDYRNLIAVAPLHFKSIDVIPYQYIFCNVNQCKIIDGVLNIYII